MAVRVKMRGYLSSPAGVLWLFLLCGALAICQSDDPLEKPGDNAYNLGANLRFLEEKLNLNGRVEYVAVIHDDKTGDEGTNSFVSEITRVRASSSTCRIDLHDAEHRDGKLLFDKDFWIDLRGVQNVYVIPRARMIRDRQEAEGETGYTFRVNPPIFVLVARWADGESDFYFRSELFANRVAKSFTRAVELCGGGTKIL